uniref:Uncharacterized protein n=1 Tax=Timema genevievae TaxID=629358 RepID=A0A7R9PR36_TIMGE|nr:unnamed protein product [Timema genevievae]
MMKFKSLFRRQAGANSSKNVHNQLQNEARSLSVSSRAATPPTRRLEPPRPIGGSVNSLDSGAKPKSKPSNFRKGHHGNNMVEAADYEALRISLEEMARQNDLLEATIATATTASEEEILALRKQLADKDALVVKMKLELRNVKVALKGCVTTFAWKENGEQFKKSTVSTPDWDLNSDLPNICSPEYCERDAFDHSRTDATPHQLETSPECNRDDLFGKCHAFSASSTHLAITTNVSFPTPPSPNFIKPMLLPVE